MTEAFTTAELAARAALLPGRILGIAGAPGAGKSTLAEALLTEFGPARAAWVGMDAFHLSDRVLRAHGSTGRKGAIDTFDDAGYASLIVRLAAARPGDPPIYAPEFDRDIEESISAAIEVRSEVPLVITEGNYLLAATGAWPRARAAMAQVWLLNPPRQVRLSRLIARHQRFGRTPDQARDRALGSDDVNARLIGATAAAADLVMDWAGE